MQKKLIMLTLVLICAITVHAQNPVKWAFSAKKLTEKTYEIHLTANISAPWHIYSQFTPEGGPVPTTVTFIKNPVVILEGVMREEGKLIKKHEKVFGIDVKFFDDQVDFVQVVKVKSNVKTFVRGTVEYMACNDTQCLPPTTIPFKIDLK